MKQPDLDKLADTIVKEFSEGTIIPREWLRKQFAFNFAKASAEDNALYNQQLGFLRIKLCERMRVIGETDDTGWPILKVGEIARVELTTAQKSLRRQISRAMRHFAVADARAEELTIDERNELLRAKAHIASVRDLEKRMAKKETEKKKSWSNAQDRITELI